MTASGSAGLVFIGDAPAQGAYAALVAEHGARWVNVTDAEINGLPDARALVIDVPLGSVAEARRLRQMLAAVPRQVPRMLVVDKTHRVEVIHAGVIGASAIAARPLDRAELAQFLRKHEHMSTGPSDGKRESADSIKTAAGSLETLFRAAIDGRAPDHAGLYSACDEIAIAIRSDGLGPWLDTVRTHHQGTLQHCLIVAGVLTRFGQGLGMARSDVRLLAEVGLLHDVGKAVIPAEILDKPGKLTAEEFAIVREHPYKGFKFLRQHDLVTADILAAVVGHHEYLDGSGYPYGLTAKSIGDLERITTVCDIYGALIEDRAYKPSMPSAQAMQVLEDLAQAGKVDASLVVALGHTVVAELTA